MGKANDLIRQMLDGGEPVQAVRKTTFVPQDGGTLIRRIVECDSAVVSGTAEYVQSVLHRQQYETWFRGKVEKGLTEINDDQGLSSEQAEARMVAFKASMENSLE